MQPGSPIESRVTTRIQTKPRDLGCVRRHSVERRHSLLKQKPARPDLGRCDVQTVIRIHTIGLANRRFEGYGLAPTRGIPSQSIAWPVANQRKGVAGLFVDYTRDGGR